MPGIPMFTGPVPPEGSSFCAVCAALWKSAVVNGPAKPAIEAATAKDNGVLTWIDLEKHAHAVKGLARPQLAVTRFVYQPMMQMGLMDLCWSHTMGLEVKDSMVVPATAAQMPQGVPLLGQGGRRG
jgi:hypothetical protein